MNYLLIYTKLISIGCNRLPFPGMHRHRIIPGYQGGKYLPENITYLTKQEHRIVHYARWKLYNHYADVCAYMYLKGNPIKGYKSPPKSEEHKEKLRQANLGKKLSEETKRKISFAIKGEKHPLFGKIPSLETREKMSKSQKGNGKGIPKSEEHRRKISIAMQGNKNGKGLLPDYKHSEKTKKKISNALKGKIPWNKGRTRHSEFVSFVEE